MKNLTSLSFVVMCLIQTTAFAQTQHIEEFGGGHSDVVVRDKLSENNSGLPYEEVRHEALSTLAKFQKSELAPRMGDVKNWECSVTNKNSSVFKNAFVKSCKVTVGVPDDWDRSGEYVVNFTFDTFDRSVTSIKTVLKTGI